MIEYIQRDWWQYAVAFLIVGGLLVILGPAAKKAGLVDRPSSRKQHSQDVPLTGGIAIFLGFSMALLLFEISLQRYRLLIFGALVMLIVGVLDDYMEVSVWKKICAQIFVSGLFVFVGGVAIYDVAVLLPTTWSMTVSNVFVHVFSVLTIVALINAINLIDGLDGLAGMVALSVFITLSFVYFDSGQSFIAEEIILVLLISVCLTVFLVFNLKRIVGTNNQAFLGDSGSMLLGLLMAYFLILWSGPIDTARSPFIRPVAAAWLIVLPMLDMWRVIICRLQRGESVVLAQRDHFHHLLLALKITETRSLIILTAMQLTICLFVYLCEIYQVDQELMFWGLMSLVAVVTILTFIPPFRRNEEIG